MNDTDQDRKTALRVDVIRRFMELTDNVCWEGNSDLGDPQTLEYMLSELGVERCAEIATARLRVLESAAQLASAL
ncbi:hypothetical protein J7E96_23370 [Streptomyces sp. ISL-96]|uniref:hypothetical protein n=1 Tax=Streptomyces sp. ISL-96 TaxID=2819191 RepID=UPI001BEB91DA|nr:hypothetical protein [Streptomyces sp. ISL-96]MBT2491410.1 hypothetical protein [Streptomyces sp. ISL-96]